MAVRVSPLDVSISELSSRIQNLRLTTSVQAGETGEEKAFYVRGPIDLQVPSVRDAVKLFGLKPSLPADKKSFPNDIPCAGGANPAYDVCHYDARYVFKKVLTDWRSFRANQHRWFSIADTRAELAVYRSAS